MGRRGPPPTPTEVLRLRGSWRAKEREGEVVFPPGRPSCPAFLSKEAKAEWKRQARALEAAGILASVDRAVLAAYCEAWAEFVDMRKRLDETGPLVKAASGNIVTNPLVTQKNRAVARLVALAGHFGFSPSARARIKAPEGQGKQGDELDEFLAGKVGS